MKNFVALLLGVLVASGVSAQSKVKFNPALSQDQIAISAGLYQAISGDELNEGINYGVDWLHNFTPAFGVRGGVAFVENLADDIHLARLPLGVTFRVGRSGSVADRVAYSVANYVFSRDHSLSSALITLLPINVEFTAGITPGVLMGSRESSSLTITGGDSWVHGVRVRNRLSLTADVGASLSLRISRVVLRLTPMYHYSLTDNFDLFSEHSTDTKTARSFFSASGSLSWMF